MGRIVRARIHPAIGIARIGSSEGFFYAPEVTTPPPAGAGSRHDGEGLLREAARFRIYGYDEAGEVVEELTAENAVIEWRAELANLKAAWYKFRAAYDQDGAEGFRVQRRNPDYPAGARGDLTIEPGARTIMGPDEGPRDRYRFRAPFTYLGESETVELGELRTDESGRLVVLSGKGRSASPRGLPVYVQSEEDGFANATGWFDDTADGPVDATVTVDGQPIPVEGAWVVVAPPNYAPDIIGWRTLHELLEELYFAAGWLAPPPRVSFTREILPVLQRMTQLQWVNAGFAAIFGAGGPLDFSDPDLIDRLSRVHGESDAYAGLRRRIFHAFRPADESVATPRSWPWIYGDAFGTFAEDRPANHLPISSYLAGRMRRWVAGDFEADWDRNDVPPKTLDEVEPAGRPAMLDEAPLHFALADAFHPGCELTWPMRHLSIYEAPFRIRRRPAGEPRRDYGTHLTHADVFADDGPLNGQGPGELTRWMAVPWQVDTAGCRSGYERSYDPTLPTFWPARVPNHVLSEENYRAMMDETKTREERIAAFHDRRSWYWPLEGRGADQMTLMVTLFDRMGVVERRVGPENDPELPRSVYVERLPPSLLGLGPEIRAELPGHPEVPADTPTQREARAAGWESEEQRQFFRAARIRR